MLRKIVVPGEKIVEEESEDSEGTDSASSSAKSSPANTRKACSRTLPPDRPPSPSPESSPLHTRSYGKARKMKDGGRFYKDFKCEGVVYLPGDINGLARKLQLLAADFFAGNTTVRTELVHVLDALLRLKQVEYTNIVYKSRRITARRYQYIYIRSGSVSTIGSPLARYATKAMLFTAAKTALRGSLDATKRAVPHLIAHKLVSTIANAAKKRNRLDINVKHSQEHQSKKALVDTGPDVNGSGIVSD